jgi:hypothetical protein
MGVFDFNNNRAQNLSDAKFEKDAVNLRTLKLFSADTLFVATAIASAITVAHQIIYEVTVPLTALQIQTGNTVPIDTGIPLPGLGKAIEVVSASIIFTANTTPFLSATIYLITDTAADSQTYSVGILGGGVNTFTRFGINTSILTTMVANKRLLVQTDADSIGTGDGVATVYVAYRIITV